MVVCFQYSFLLFFVVRTFNYAILIALGPSRGFVEVLLPVAVCFIAVLFVISALRSVIFPGL